MFLDPSHVDVNIRKLMRIISSSSVAHKEETFRKANASVNGRRTANSRPRTSRSKSVEIHNSGVNACYASIACRLRTGVSSARPIVIRIRHPSTQKVESKTYSVLSR